MQTTATKNLYHLHAFWEEGGRLHGGDADLSAGGSVSPDGVKENQEHKGGLVEEPKWLDGAESGVQPKTAPGERGYYSACGRFPCILTCVVVMGTTTKCQQQSLASLYGRRTLQYENVLPRF